MPATVTPRWMNPLPAPETPEENRLRLAADRCVPGNKPKGGNYDRDPKDAKVNRSFVKKDGQW